MNTHTSEIVWRLRLNAPPHHVFTLLATDEGRATFWAERTEQLGERVIFHFPNGGRLESRVLESNPPSRFRLSYFDGSIVTFELRPAGAGTDLCLREVDLPATDYGENRAGWVSVLLNLKAQADHGLDLRNHDPQLTWNEGYVDN